jgi:hypothetical protein
MRRIVTGTDSRGRSCVVDDVVLPDAVGEFDTQRLFLVSLNDLPQRPEGRAELLDLGVPAGVLRWSMTRWAPRTEYPLMHHTDTIDLDLVVAGSITLLLDDGEHLLEAGDAAVIPGVDHAWRAGPEGCTLAHAFIGTPPRPLSRPAT